MNINARRRVLHDTLGWEISVPISVTIWSSLGHSSVDNDNLTTTSECTVCLTVQSLNLCHEIKGKREVEEESEVDLSNDDKETRDMVSMGWRGMLSFSATVSIVCTQLAVAQQAGPPAEGLFHHLRSNGMWQVIWTSEMSQALKKRNWDNCPFQKNLKPNQTMRGWGQNLKSQWHSSTVKQNICGFFLVEVFTACRWLSARNWLMSKQHYSQTKKLCNTPPGSWSDNALMEGVIYSALNAAKLINKSSDVLVTSLI